MRLCNDQARGRGRAASPLPQAHKEPARGGLPPLPSGKALTQAFLSQEKDVTPDKNLLTKVRDAALWLDTLPDSRPAEPALSTSAYVADFFLALTICNSVMVSTTAEPRQRVRTDDGGGGGRSRGEGRSPEPGERTLGPLPHCRHLTAETLSRSLTLSGPQSPHVKI